jgi:hypothetical protein
MEVLILPSILSPGHAFGAGVQCSSPSHHWNLRVVPIRFVQNEWTHFLVFHLHSAIMLYLSVTSHPHASPSAARHKSQTLSGCCFAACANTSDWSLEKSKLCSIALNTSQFLKVFFESCAGAAENGCRSSPCGCRSLMARHKRKEKKIGEKISRSTCSKNRAEQQNC